jgi:transcriptional regulator with XRE-family HTH domain
VDAVAYRFSDRYVKKAINPNVVFGARLRELRQAAGISQEALAGDAGLHRNYVGMLERAKQSATLDAICKLAAALKVRPAVLLDTLP